MKPKHLLIFGLLWALVGCGSTVVRDSYEPVSLTPPPTATAAAAVVTDGADIAALTFFRAWENEDYIGMYDLIVPRVQSLVDSDTFIKRYRDAQQEARVTGVRVQPQALLQEGESAEFQARVIWETAVVGSIVRDHTVPLIFENGRWFIDWTESLILPELAGGNSLRMLIESPSRATIFDRGGEQLAFQGESIRVIGVLPQRLQDEDGFLAAVGQVLGEEPDALQARYINNPPDWYTPLGTITVETIQDNYDLLTPYFGAGLQIEEQNGRLYTEDAVAPHLVGYTGPISAESWLDYWAKGYQIDARVGVSGLEAVAEPYLAGTPGGRLTLRSPAGETIDIVQQTEATPSRNIYTSFDWDFQAGVEAILANAIAAHPSAESGAIVVLDVNTGAVRAIATYPTYDAVLFAEIRSDDGTELAAVLNDPRRPLLNRAVQGEYPAGSTFKIVTTAAALHYDYFDADTRFNCTGVWDGLGANNLKYDWLPQGHGTITLQQGLTRSCNPYMYEIGFVIDGSDSMQLPDMAREFGLGAATGIGVAEGRGIIPDPTWKLENLGEGWVPGDAVNMAIGQGFLLATPLQITNMTAAVANGGTLYQPTLIDRIDGVRGVPETIVQPMVRNQLPLSAADLSTIQQSMDDVTDGPSGTAVSAMAGLAVPTAGKTGTAEVPNPDNLPHAWFTGYAPAGAYTTPEGRQLAAPEIAITVLIENGGEGSAVAAPIFRQVVELYYGLPQTALPTWR